MTGSLVRAHALQFGILAMKNLSHNLIGWCSFPKLVATMSSCMHN